MARFVYATSVAVWLGTVVSFSYIFLPTIHAAIEGGRTHELLQRIFPRYHLIGIVCGLVAVAAVSLPPASPRLPVDERVRLAFPIVVSLLCTLVAYRFLLPRLAGLQRSAEPHGYERLHRAAVMLNSTVLAMLILAIAATVTR